MSETIEQRKRRIAKKKRAYRKAVRDYENNPDHY